MSNTTIGVSTWEKVMDDAFNIWRASGGSDTFSSWFINWIQKHYLPPIKIKEDVSNYRA